MEAATLDVKQRHPNRELIAERISADSASEDPTTFKKKDGMRHCAVLEKENEVRKHAIVVSILMCSSQNRRSCMTECNLSMARENMSSNHGHVC